VGCVEKRFVRCKKEVEEEEAKREGEAGGRGGGTAIEEEV